MVTGKFQFGAFLIFLCVGSAPAQIKKDITWVVGSVLVDPFLTRHETKTERGTTTHYEGYIVDLLDEITKKLNIDYTLHVRNDNEFGYKFANGSWSGLIGDIINSGDVDIVAAPLTETAARYQKVDFSTPFMNFGQVVILKKPKSNVMTLRKRFKRLYSPLSEGVWLTSILAWMGTSVVLYIIGHVNPYEWRRLAKNKEATKREAEAGNCPNVFFFTVSTGLLQGYIRAPRSLGGRIVACFWWTYALSFVIMYIASMTNYLKIGPTEKLVDHHANIQKLEDLANQNDVKYGVLQNGATLQFLKNSPNNRLRRMGEEIRTHDRFMSTFQKGIDEVRDSSEPFAFITESAMASFYAKQRPCDIYMIGDFTVVGSYSIAMSINFTGKNGLNTALLELKEAGIMKKLHDRWFTGECTDFLMDASQTEQYKVPPFYRVDMATFSGALIVLCVGHGLGALVTLIEIVIYRNAENVRLEEKEQRDADKAQRSLDKDGAGYYETNDTVTAI